MNADKRGFGKRGKKKGSSLEHELRELHERTDSPFVIPAEAGIHGNDNELSKDFSRITTETKENTME
ncbi:MAG: hypothetical protein C4532_17680 [Candidatus Abyssobacteria bacterium SURF_17]|uniref:Uncharacterized protein n=1 Tax=Candidatus Abyssobacteria bacterium SURF_17 TaxID=2093361 RepID=A0A419EQC0_9BACT|nr:MAG: hypothetical protein C4532_17680 [Candidatus Abyssubacteria bacterium SURF_17]